MTMPHSSAAVVASDPIPAARPTFAELAARIAADPAVSPWRRRSLPAYLTALCRHLGLDPATTPADLAPLGERLAAFRPRQAGIGKRHWDNILGGARWALRHAGLPAPRNRDLAPLTPPWAASLAALPAAACEARYRLGRFARWCGRRGLAPADVDQAVAEAFRAERRAAGASAERAERDFRDLVRAWNKAAAAVPGWPPARLVLDPHPTRWTPSFDELPPSLRADLEAHLAWLGRSDPLAEHAPRRALKPGAVRGRVYELRAFLGSLREAGYALADLRRLHDLVEPEAVRAGLRRLLLRSHGGDTRRTYKVACAVLVLARDDLRVGADHIAALAGFCRQLQPRDEGMTAKVRARLSAFDDELNVAALLQARERLMADARAAAPDDRAAALLAQSAVLLEILLFAPVRRGNAAALHLERHLSFDRRAGTARLVVPAEEVKNGQRLEFDLPPEATALLREYLERFRPRLGAGAAGPWLFPGRGPARPKCPQALSAQLTAVIRKYLGVDATPHLLRHVVVKLFLERHPGSYEVARLMLGHRHLATTMRIYAGTETRAAARHFDAVILDLRHGDGAVPPPARPRPVPAPRRPRRRR